MRLADIVLNGPGLVIGIAFFEYAAAVAFIAHGQWRDALFWFCYATGNVAYLGLRQP